MRRSVRHSAMKMANEDFIQSHFGRFPILDLDCDQAAETDRCLIQPL